MPSIQLWPDDATHYYKKEINIILHAYNTHTHTNTHTICIPQLSCILLQCVDKGILESLTKKLLDHHWPFAPQIASEGSAIASQPHFFAELHFIISTQIAIRSFDFYWCG